MNKRCRQCNERAAVTGSLRWYTSVILLLFDNACMSDDYCEDCAGGRNFMAVIFVVVLALVVFVIAVIVG
jgi:hypothetical protein